MSFKTEITSDRAPKAVGPYSAGLCLNGLVVFSGQLPIDPATGKMPETIEEQARQSLNNVAVLLEAADLTFDHVIRSTVYLADMQDFAALNRVYSTYFRAPYPARSCVQVAALPFGAKVEIEVTCVRGSIPTEQPECGCCAE